MAELSLLPSSFICSISYLISIVSWIFTFGLGYNPILCYSFCSQIVPASTVGRLQLAPGFLALT